MRHQSSKSAYLVIIATAFLINTLCTAQLLPDDPTYVDYYCGWDWEEANAGCEFHCPSGLDKDCPPLPNGRKRGCIAAAGCFSRFEKLYWTGVISLSFDREQHLSNTAVTTTPATGDGEAVSEADPSSLGLMTNEEKKAFELSFEDYLFAALQEQMQISGVTVQDQEYDKPCVAAAFGVDDPTSTALDMEIRVVGEYIPIDFTITDDQFGEKVLNAVNAYPESFVDAIKESSPSSFFEALKPNGIAAIEEEEVVESPSSSPSESPTRGFDQMFDVRIDPRPTGSYGIVFNVRTPRDGNTILLTGLSFVTLHEGNLEYEVYSKLGPFDRFVGRTSMFELVASGQTKGNGAQAYTRLLEEDTVVANGVETLNYIGFKPLHVPGDRGQRSFYITMTKRFTTDDGGPIPVLFSYPISGTEGEREYAVVDNTEELEIYEGDGVLDYPWPKEKDGPYYRRPRGFIGSFDYERYPCHPIINFTDWPCPYVPRTKEPAGNPTMRPTPQPTTKPTKNPTNNDPTKDPVIPGAQLATGTDAPELVPPDPEGETASELAPPDPAAETDNNESTELKVGIEEEDIANAGTLVAYIRYGGGLAIYSYWLWLMYLL